MVVHDPDVTVADLATALGADGDLYVDGRRCPAERRLDRAGAAQGATLTARAPATGTSVTAARPASLTVRVAGGLDAGASALLGPGRFPIGRAEGVLDLRDTTVSARHAVLDLDGVGRLTVHDAGSHNGTWFEGTSVVAPVAVEPGGVLRLGASQLVAAPTVDDRPVGGPGRMTAAGTVPFNRRPRPAPAAAADPLEPPTAPEARPAPSPVGVVGVVAPLVMGLVMVVVFRSLVFGLFALLSPVLLVGNTIESRRRERRGSRRDRARYERELEAFGSTLRSLAAVERERLADELPDPAEVARRALAPSTRLWERRLHHPDALHLRAGLGAVAWQPPIAGDRRGWSPEVRATVAEAERIEGAPALVDLSDGGVVGVVGDRQAALAVARSLVAQAATHHGPADVAVAVLAAPERADHWDWAKWLPHTLDAGGSGQRLLAADTDAAEALLRGLLERQVTEAAHRSATPSTVTLVVIDDPSLTEGRRSPARSLLRSDAVAGIVVAPTEDRLPAVCRTVVELRDGDGTARVDRVDNGERLDDVLAAGISDDTARLIAAGTRPLRRPGARRGGRRSAPARSACSPCSAFDPPTADELLARWATSGDDPDLLAPLGVGEDGVLEVDLVRDGPHGLVAGTTGAGKSELLRTLVAGLAAALLRRTTSPSCSSTSRAAARSTLRRAAPHRRPRHRPRRPPRGRARSAASRPSSAAASARLRDGRRRRPDRAPATRGRADRSRDSSSWSTSSPRCEPSCPTFVDSLVGVAQRGRSLGVHLVLATQRPSGAVSDHIRANTNLRIALRVQDRGRLRRRDRPARRGPHRPRPARPGARPPRAGRGRRGADRAAPRASHAPRATGRSRCGRSGSVRSGPDGDRGAGHRDRHRERPPAPGRRGDRGPSPIRPSAAPPAVAGPAPARGRPRRDPHRSGVGSGGALRPGRRPGRAGPVPGGLGPDGRQPPVRGHPGQRHDHRLRLGGPRVGRRANRSTTCTSTSSTWARATCAALGSSARGLGGHRGGAGAPAPPRALAAVRARPATGGRRGWQAPTGGRRRPRRPRGVPGAVGRQSERCGRGPAAGVRRRAGPPHPHGRHRRSARGGPGVAPVARPPALAVPLRRPARALVGRARAADVPALGPGGAVLADGGLVVQVARPADGLTSAVARLATTHHTPTRPPTSIGVLPTYVDPQAIVGAARLDDERWVLPVGIEQLDARGGRADAVPGRARAGRRTIPLGPLDQPGGHRPHGAAPPAPTSTSSRSPRAGRRSGRARTSTWSSVPRTLACAELTAAPGPALVLVDDADLVDGTTGALTALLAQGRPGLHVVAAGRNEALRAAYGHWTRPVRSSRATILLQPDRDLDGDLAGTTLPRRSIVALTRGRGYLSCGGELDVVQIAALHESE